MDFFQDYIEAFEKLHQLAIKDHRVIVTVIIHCCLAEKLFNPYYAVLSQKFCDVDRKYQVSDLIKGFELTESEIKLYLQTVSCAIRCLGSH